MARFAFAYLFASSLILTLSGVGAAPTSASAVVSPPGQLANATCNIVRLETIVGLERSTSSVQKALNVTGSNTGAASLLNSAESGLESAQEGVNTILQALFTGKAPPADARNQVGDGLGNATSALLSAVQNSTSPDLTLAIITAQAAVAETLVAGIKVVNDCN